MLSVGVAGLGGWAVGVGLPVRELLRMERTGVEGPNT